MTGGRGWEAVAWWLGPGSESCRHCLRSYRIEAAYWCAECDEAICPACVVTIVESRSALCPACHRGGRG